ncbi:MAG: hypothetical protein ACUVRY_03875 [Thermoanaerobaculaceae bacterium]
MALGCGTLFFIVLLVSVLGGLWLWKKGKDWLGAASKNPAVAAAKLAAAANPDIEVVSSDDEEGTVTLRNKKTGQVITLNAKDIKEGKLQIFDEKGESVDVKASSSGSSFRLSSKKGQLTVGEEGSLPPWIPLPEGVKPVGFFQAESEKGIEGGASFETDALPSEILAFYREALEEAGLSPTVSKFEQDGKLMGGLVSGKAAGSKKLTVTVTAGQSRTSVALLFSEAR